MSQRWFATRSVNDGLLTAPNLLLLDKETWAEQIIRDGQLFEDCKCKSHAVAAYHSTKKDIEDQITNTRRDLVTAAIQGGIWQRDRQSTSQTRVTTALQSSLTSFSRFVENFSGLVEIAKGADEQYGGLAFGTLSLLLSAFARKSQNEETLLDAFEELSYAFPRLETLVRLEPHKQLEALVATSFTDIVLFARETTKYYSSRSRRVKAIFSPEPEAMKHLDSIRKSLCQIRQECDMLMLMQIGDLSYKVDQMALQLKITGADVQRTECHVLRQNNYEDIKYLSTLRRLLGLKDALVNIDLNEYGSFLRIQFSAENLHLKHCHPRTPSLQLLEQDKQFCSWWNNEGSYLLLAGGTNAVDDYCIVSLIWMSICAVVVVEQLRKDNRKVAFCLSRTGHASRGSDLRSIMASLLYQLVKLHSDLLRSRLADLQDLVQTPCWKEVDDDGLLESMERLLLEFFAEFDDADQINIVIDRLDQCSGSEDSEEALSRLKEVLHMLLKVVSRAHCRVKILLTVDAWYSRKCESRKLAGLLAREKERLLLKADWQQETEEDLA